MIKHQSLRRVFLGGAILFVPACGLAGEKLVGELDGSDGGAEGQTTSGGEGAENSSASDTGVHDAGQGSDGQTTIGGTADTGSSEGDWGVTLTPFGDIGVAVCDLQMASDGRVGVAYAATREVRVEPLPGENPFGVEGYVSVATGPEHHGGPDIGQWDGLVTGIRFAPEGNLFLRGTDNSTSTTWAGRTTDEVRLDAERLGYSWSHYGVSMALDSAACVSKWYGIDLDAAGNVLSYECQGAACLTSQVRRISPDGALLEEWFVTGALELTTGFRLFDAGSQGEVYSIGVTLGDNDYAEGVVEVYREASISSLSLEADAIPLGVWARPDGGANVLFLRGYAYESVMLHVDENLGVLGETLLPSPGISDLGSLGAFAARPHGGFVQVYPEGEQGSQSIVRILDDDLQVTQTMVLDIPAASTVQIAASESDEIAVAWAAPGAAVVELRVLRPS